MPCLRPQLRPRPRPTTTADLRVGRLGPCGARRRSADDRAATHRHLSAEHSAGVEPLPQPGAGRQCRRHRLGRGGLPARAAVPAPSARRGRGVLDRSRQRLADLDLVMGGFVCLRGRAGTSRSGAGSFDATRPRYTCSSACFPSGVSRRSIRIASSTVCAGRSTVSSRRPACWYSVSVERSRAAAMALSTWADGVYTPRSIWLRYGFETAAIPASWRIESDMSSRCVRMNSPTDLSVGGVGGTATQPWYCLESQATEGPTARSLELEGPAAYRGSHSRRAPAMALATTIRIPIHRCGAGWIVIPGIGVAYPVESDHDNFGVSDTPGGGTAHLRWPRRRGHRWNTRDRCSHLPGAGEARRSRRGRLQPRSRHGVPAARRTDRLGRLHLHPPGQRRRTGRLRPGHRGRPIYPRTG